MPDLKDRTPSKDAVARRRRMHYRQTKRRLTKVAVATFVVYGAALLAKPEAAIKESAPKASNTVRSLSVRLPKVASLPIQPLWRPAGEVLTRSKTAVFPSLALGFDAKDGERRESLSRLHRIYTYSAKYRIKQELARKIYDAATAAGIEPELAFRLVRVESVFKTNAVSSAGALGLTQLMLGTAREYEPNVTREELLDPDINLRIGFKYLRGLIRDYKGDLKLALLVYNRGPVAVQNALSMGLSPANGYESIITKGYRGRGVLE